MPAATRGAIASAIATNPPEGRARGKYRSTGAHAASAFFPSPFREAAILTIDGVGEWTTASIGIGKDGTIRLLKEIRFLAPAVVGALMTHHVEAPRGVAGGGDGAVGRLTLLRGGVASPLGPRTRVRVTAERAFLAALEGGCQVPVAALAQVNDDEVVLDGLVAAVDGSRLVRGTRRGPAAEAQEVGRRLAEELRKRGAGEILAAIRGEEGSKIISVNGAAAHKAGVGHRLIICAYAHYSEAELANFKPHVLYMGADGELSHTSNAIPVQVA